MFSEFPFTVVFLINQNASSVLPCRKELGRTFASFGLGLGQRTGWITPAGRVVAESLPDLSALVSCLSSAGAYLGPARRGSLGLCVGGRADGGLGSASVGGSAVLMAVAVGPGLSGRMQVLTSVGTVS